MENTSWPEIIRPSCPGACPTPAGLLARAGEWGEEEGLLYVYRGNRLGSGGEDTLCPGCGAKAVERRGFSLLSKAMGEKGECLACGARVAGVFG